MILTMFGYTCGFMAVSAVRSTATGSRKECNISHISEEDAMQFT
jgi:hypothetical protein